MRILCTNDDGVHATGLSVLEGIARTRSDDVWVVGPELEQSGASRALTLTALAPTALAPTALAARDAYDES